MNLIEHYVTEIIGETYEKYDKWWLIATDTTIMLNSKEEAQKVDKSYVFLA